MRQFLTIVLVFLIAWVLILFPSATKYSTAEPLPKGLPPWFKEIDKDHDGQVSLPEWLLSGKKLDDFRHFDLNGDGFITPEEVLRVLKKVQHLNLEHGRVNFDGAIEEATDERYQGKKTFKVFTLKLEEGTTYQIEEVSQVFYAYLYLEDPNGNIVAEHNSGGRGQTARLIHQADETGTYRLIATSQDGVKTGEFSLSIHVVPEDDDVSKELPTIRIVPGMGENLPPGLPLWFKEFDRDQDGQVSLQEWLLAGRNRDEFLLYDLNGDGFITADEVLRVVQNVQPLTWKKGRVDYQGAIEEATDERYENKKTFKIFSIKLEEGTTYQIEEVSQAFSAYLYLEDPNGNIVDEHNSGGRGLTARLSYQAEETGIYRIIATSQDGVKTGAFSLSIRVVDDQGSLPPPSLPPWFKELDKDQDGQVSLQEWLLGGRSRDDFRLYDRNGDGFITPDEAPQVVKKVKRLKLEHGRLNYQGTIEEATEERYQNKKTFKIFTLKLEEGTIYQIEEVSQVFYAYLYLEDPSGNIVAEHNSGGRGQTARLIHQAEETGIYRLIATSQDGVKTGDFSLSIRIVHDLGGSPPPQKLPSWFKELDKDQDGQVSLEEWLQGGKSRDEFRLYDTNGDGFITPAEVLHYLQGQSNSKEKGNAKVGGSLPQGLPPWFKELDKDHDGQVSLQEWLQGGKKPDEFRLYDINGDGFITPEEVLRYMRILSNSQKKGNAKPG